MSDVGHNSIFRGLSTTRGPGSHMYRQRVAVVTIKERIRALARWNGQTHSAELHLVDILYPQDNEERPQDQLEEE
jgi:hypothetical protein